MLSRRRESRQDSTSEMLYTNGERSFRKYLQSPPEPDSVHFVERPEQHGDIRLLKIVQAVGNNVQIGPPALASFCFRFQQICERQVRMVFQVASVGRDRIGKVRTDSHQTTFIPMLFQIRIAGIVDQFLRRHGLFKASGIVASEDSRCLPGNVGDLDHLR